MTLDGIDESQRKAAKIAGFAGLLAIPFVVYANFAVHDRLIVAGNAAETARNILAHETLFRFSIACDLIYSAGLILLLAALFVILEPVNRTLAMVAAFWRFVYALMWVRMTLNLYDALRLVKGADYLQTFEVDRLQALANLFLRERFDEYYVGLLFWGVAATVCAWLWLKSGYIPRPLAWFGVIASGWCAAITLAFIIWPAVSTPVNLWWFDTGIMLFEIATSFWLLFRGLRPAAAADPRQRAA